MAQHIDFEQANFTWQGDGEDVNDLRAFVHRLENGQVETISLWKLTPEEIFEIVQTGQVWLRVFGYQPPVSVQAHTPFKNRNEDG